MTPLITRHLAALGLCGLDIAVRAVRLRLLVCDPRRPALWPAVRVNAYGDAAAAITPARLGGDLARFLGLRHLGVDTPGTLVALGAERLLSWALIAAAAVLFAVAFADRAVTGLGRLVSLARTPEARVLLALALGLAAASAVLARRYRHRLPPDLTASLTQLWRRAQSLPAPLVAGATALTALSMMARIAILPVLVSGHPEIDRGALVVGSFALLYGQLFLPTPAGAGGVELGFIAGFRGTLTGRELAGLLVAWRVYTLILGAALGGALLARGALGRLWTSSRYRSTSSVKVRSHP